MQIFLAPRSNETSYKNFLSTIENGVNYHVIAPYLDEEGRKILAPLGKLYAWGNKETKKSSWEKMEIDDLILFYKGREGNEREGKFVYAGKLLYKQYSRDLGLSLWPPKPGEEPWICIFFLKDLKPVYLPLSVIADAANYGKGFVVQGFMPLKQEATRKLMQQFGSVEHFLSAYALEERHLKPDVKGFLEGEPEETTPVAVSSEVRLHSQVQTQLEEIGKILAKYVEKEYHEAPYTYDVIWKDVQWLPRITHAFEVQDKGNLIEALAKLKHAHDSWGSNLFLVVTGEKDRRKLDQVLEPHFRGTFHEIASVTTVLSPEDVQELCQSLNRFEPIIKRFLSK